MENLLKIHQPPPTSTLTIAPSKAEFVYPREPGQEHDSDITWCKFAVIFPNNSTHSRQYNTFQKAMKCKMEQDRIPGFVVSTADQWAAIQADAFTIPPVVPHRAQLWQINTRQGQRFTGCVVFY